jgi:uncharacterized membrane protein
MEDAPHDSLEQRVARLESEIVRLKRLTDLSDRSETDVAALADSDTVETPQTTSSSSSGEHAASKPAIFRRIEGVLGTENWLNKVGIGLLLFGLIFLFKYSVDQGWLTPMVRVLFGILLGFGLMFFASQIYELRRHLSLVLFGGGVASCFVTGFAAFQVFSLIPHSVAYTFLVAVTVGTFLISLRQNEPILALVGVIGGFTTPFLLYTSIGTLAGLLTYSSILVGGASAIYFFKGWRSLLWLTVLGGWMVVSVGEVTTLSFSKETAAGKRLSMQIGILFAWAVFAVVPLIRERWSSRDPASHPTFFSDDNQLGLSEWRLRFRHQDLLILIAITPLLALFFSSPIWTLSDLSWGLIILTGAVLYGGVSWALARKESFRIFFPPHALVGITLFTIALAVIFDGNPLMLALTAEALILNEISLRNRRKKTHYLTHILSIIVLIWLVVRLLDHFSGTTPLLNPDSLTNLAVLGAGAVIAFRSPSKKARIAYAGFVHVCLLALLYRDLLILDSAQGIVSIVWGAYGIGLFITGLFKNIRLIRSFGSITLLIVVLKLFLVDLAMLDTIWRVLLFMGFGGIFLALSYFFRDLLGSSK